MDHRGLKDLMVHQDHREMAVLKVHKVLKVSEVMMETLVVQHLTTRLQLQPLVILEQEIWDLIMEHYLQLLH